MDVQSVITKMDDSSLKELMQLLSSEEINITKSPETGLLMMTAKDSFNTDFYLGEILVTEAAVGYKGLKGYAMVMAMTRKAS
jgi:phosphonate C-P lyase system protein PhnG